MKKIVVKKAWLLFIFTWLLLVGAIVANLWGYYETRHQLECFQNADLNCDRKTDSKDLSMLLSHYTSKNTKTQTDVPPVQNVKPAATQKPVEFKTGPIWLQPVPIYIHASMEQTF